MRGRVSVKKKVLVYITRVEDGRTELLVFTHRDFPEAGIQVPAGTIEKNEKPEEAAIRETFEESGVLISEPNFVGVYEWIRRDTHQPQLRYVYHFSLVDSAADSWSHAVGGKDKDEDRGMIFNFYWIPLEEGLSVLAAQQGLYLQDI